jgi:hypothetical protein
MAGYFSGDKIIKVNVANGSRNNIWCRVAGDKALKVKGETGGGLDVHGVGVNAHKAQEVQHVHGATRGCTQIQRGNTLAPYIVSATISNIYFDYLIATEISRHTACKENKTRL